jgi:uncharacterized protein (DUF1330 family)
VAAYLLYLCESVNDRAELEIYWEEIGPTFQGHNVKLLAGYTKFKVLEGNKKIEGVVLAEFPSWEEAQAWYDSPAYSAIRHHRINGAKYIGLLVDGGVVPDSERMPQTKTNK